MTNKECIIERQVNMITLKALRNKVRHQCATVRQSISDSETQLNETVDAGRDKYAMVDVKVSIK